MTNPYKILGLEPSASEEEVKEAYREKAKEHHPDQGGDEEKFKEIGEAKKQILEEGYGFSDKQARTGQQKTNINFNDIGGFGGKGGFGGSKSVEDIISDFMEFRRSGGFEGGGFQGDPFGQQGPFSEAQQGHMPEYPVRIDFKDAVFGGEVYVPEAAQNVEVPPGVKNGTKLKVGGNFLIEIQVQNDTEFRRKNGNDLHIVKEISAFDAMTGTDIEIVTLSEEIIHLSVDPGTSDGEIYRMSGWGGPKTFNDIPQGDMYVEVSVNIPAIKDDTLQEQIQNIQDRV